MNPTTQNSANIALDGLIGYQLRRLSLWTMADLTAALEPLDLRPTEASILAVMIARPGITQSELGRLLGVQRANMAPLVAGLEARGYLARERVDGRSHALRLTPDGTEMGAKAMAAAQESDRRCFSALSEEERQALAAQLRGLSSAGAKAAG